MAFLIMVVHSPFYLYDTTVLNRLESSAQKLLSLLIRISHPKGVNKSPGFHLEIKSLRNNFFFHTARFNIVFAILFNSSQLLFFWEIKIISYNFYLFLQVYLIIFYPSFVYHDTVIYE